MSVAEKSLHGVVARADKPFVSFGPRVFFFGSTALLSLAIVVFFAHSVTQWTFATIVALPLVFLNAVWIAGGAVTALLGLMQPRTVVGDTAGMAPPDNWSPDGTTAILMTLCGEDPNASARHLDQLFEDLSRRGLLKTTRIFVLSDTSGAVKVAHEQAALESLIAGGRITYRRRANALNRKPGNIADWLEANGHAYRYMMVLDADSRMSARRVRQMIWRLENRPNTGLIQAGIALTPGRSNFGRYQRTSSRLLSGNFGQGFAAWSGSCGNYWGHNAIMRVTAFRAASNLPCLSGPAPFRGALLSHDFVEAAWIRRAGWAVELDPELAGSAEDAPQTLEEFHRRDRRWCQGNLQHVGLLFEPGLHPVSRFHLASGVFSYLTAPCWLILIILIGSGALSVSGLLPLVLVAIVLLLPKLCALATWLGRARTTWRRRIVLRAWTSELGLSTVLAPLIMVRQAVSVGSVLVGNDCGWKTARRERWQPPRGALESAAGLGFVGLSTLIGTTAALWFLPLILPMVGAPLIVRVLDAEG